MNSKILHSFIVTLTFRGKPIIFRLVTIKELFGAHEVTALNDKDFPPFLMEAREKDWVIASDVPDDLKPLEPKMSAMINAYLEGQGLSQAKD